jgi:hypothetical protein
MSENQSPAAPSYADFVRKLFNRSGDLSKDFTHAILGVVTEINEYLTAIDEVNGLEELGDLEFYLEALGQVVADARSAAADGSVIALDLTPLYTQARLVSFEAVIANESATLLDQAKRWVGYGKQPTDLQAVLNQAVSLVVFANLGGKYPNMDHDRIRKVNMAKLLKRYPGGEFDAYRAIVRDVEAERVVLQAS